MKVKIQTDTTEVFNTAVVYSEKKLKEVCRNFRKGSVDFHNAPNLDRTF